MLQVARIRLTAGVALLTDCLEAGLPTSRNVLLPDHGVGFRPLGMAPLGYLFFHRLMLDPRQLATALVVEFLLLAIFKLRLHGAATIRLVVGAAGPAVRWF